MQTTEVTIRGTQIRIEVESGIACGVVKSNETYVGGGGQHVSSTVVRRTTYSVLGTDGLERSHHISTGLDPFLRNGNRVSLIRIPWEGTKTATVGLVNHDTREFTILFPDVEVPGLVQRLGLARKVSGGCLAIAIVLAVIMASSVLEPFASVALLIAGGVAALVFVAKTVQWYRALAIWNGRLPPALTKLANQLLADTETVFRSFADHVQ